MAALLSLRAVRREYPAGEGTLAVLEDIDLDIAAGEFVAIVGASGSGKSTLMNILGCLDRPTSGSYRIAGQEAASLGPDALAALRREHFGFIFQRYHLLGELSALGNVEIPAVYAGLGAGRREDRAAALLARLGMQDRLGHRPGQLSGGQQQRVSIARALMNDGAVILADEPTGALDSRSGEEVLRILDELNAEGRTVVIVTHDMEVARRAGRIVELRDGVIIADRRTARIAGPAAPRPAPAPVAAAHPLRAAGSGGRLREALRMAILAMRAHRLRTLLTMLGIIIGIASVISVVALGQGSRLKVLDTISGLGTSTLEIFPGKDFGDVRSGRIRTLVVADAEALGRQPYVAAITPTVQASSTLRNGSTEVSVQLTGVGEGYFDARGLDLLAGRLFGAEAVTANAQEAVIDTNTRDTVFAGDPSGGVGRTVILKTTPVTIIGVVEVAQGPGANNLSVYMPYTAVQARLTGSNALRSIMLRVADDADMDETASAVTALITERHGRQDFFILNTDEIRSAITGTTETLALLVASIALISLLVGGIGVMNIMLVSVSERVGEIGVRMAVGARQSDILQQFLVEAVLVCVIGGILGIAAALAFGAVFGMTDSAFTLVYTPGPMVLAVVSSSVIGILFGYLPARSASRLDPVAALAAD